MLDKILSKALVALLTMILTVFGFTVWADLTNILFGPLDEIIYGVLITFMGWCIARIKKLAQRGEL